MTIRAYDVEVTAEDAVRAARAGNAFLLLRHLEWHVARDVVRVIEDIAAGRLTVAIVRPCDEVPTKAEVEATIAQFVQRVKDADPRALAWLRARRLPRTRKAEAALHYAAAFYGCSARAIREVRYPQPGRNKRRSITT